MTVSSGPQNGGLLSKLDSYRFYIMGGIGLMLLGYLFLQQQQPDTPLTVEAVPSAARFPKEAPEPKTKASKGSATKVQAKNEPREDDVWIGLHDKYTYDIQTKAKGSGLDIIFYGDSIFESWKGTQMGIVVPKFKGIPEVWAEYYKPRKAASYSIAGDLTSNLLWRIISGESPAPLSPKAIVVLIGTNDLNKLAISGDIVLEEPAEAGKIVAKGITAVVDVVLEESPSSQVLLLGLLPRGDKAADDKFAQPSKYTGTIESTNAALKAYAKQQSQVTYLDCGGPFVMENRLVEDLMPDVLHPNAAGMETLVKCMQPALDKALEGREHRRFSRHLMVA